MKRVLVSDGEQRATLAVVRSLAAAGYRVEVASRSGDSLAGASRYCEVEHRLTDPQDDPRGYLRSLADVVERRAIDVFIPMTDVTAAVSLELSDVLPEVLLPFPDRRTWAEAADKARLMEIAAEVGVPVPRQVVLSSVSTARGEAKSLAKGLGYPVIVKPHRSAVPLDSSVLRCEVRIADDDEALDGLLDGLPPEAFPIIVQERVQGPGLGGFFLCRDGRVVASFAHRRLREKPPTGGVSVLRESVELRADIDAFSRLLLDRLKWSGVAMVEFKEDSATGRPYLMEINGRFWGSLQLAIDAGIDFPSLLLSAFGVAGDPSHPDDVRASYEVGVKSRWLWGDIDHLLWLLRAPKGYRRHYPHLPGRLGAIGRFLLPGRRRRFEVLRLSDPGPFRWESREWFRQVLG